MTRRHHNELRASAGFTLLEMMLAVALLGIMLAMLAESFHTVAISKVHAEDRLFTDRAGRAVIWELTKEIRGAVQTPIVPSHVAFIGVGRSQFGNTADALTLSTLDSGHGRSIIGYGSENIVTWSAVPNRDHPGWLMLERAQQSGLLDTNNSTNPVILAPNLVALHLRYFDGDQWSENWDSTTVPPGRQLPVAVAIDMKMATPSGGILNFSTEVMIPMAISQW
jgi:prepilin-type N-terminal cleavage/methylation domain-containing protein